MAWNFMDKWMLFIVLQNKMHRKHITQPNSRNDAQAIKTNLWMQSGAKNI